MEGAEMSSRVASMGGRVALDVYPRSYESRPISHKGPLRPSLPLAVFSSYVPDGETSCHLAGHGREEESHL